MPGAMSVASAIPGARQGGPDTSGRLPTTAIGRHGAMQRLDGQLVLSPTDLTHHQECRHLTWLDLGVATGEWAAPDVEVSEALQLVFDRGLDHEKKYLESLKTAVEDGGGDRHRLRR